MLHPLKAFNEFIDRPLFGWGRVALALLVIPLVLAVTAPLWRIELHAPQYPPLLGTKQIANFTSTSLPQLGTLFVGLFATGAAALLVWHLVAGRRAAVRAERALILQADALPVL